MNETRKIPLFVVTNGERKTIGTATVNKTFTGDEINLMEAQSHGFVIQSATRIKE